MNMIKELIVYCNNYVHNKKLQNLEKTTIKIHELVKNNEIKFGEKINFVVPTGNFGNILACYIAKQMGLCIDKIVCASNENNVLTDFFTTYTYDKNRKRSREYFIGAFW